MSPLSVEWEDPATTILALLLCGHVLAVFLFESNWMIRKDMPSLRGFVVHALKVGLVQGVVVLAFSWSVRGLLLVGGIALTHLALDRIRFSLDRRYPRHGVWWLLGDQAAHACVLLSAWKMWTVPEGAGSAPVIGWAATLLAVIVFNGNGGSAIVARTLASMDVPKEESGDEDKGPEGAGRKIGILERWMILGLVCAGQWGAVGLVLTAKSIARFKKMDQQAFAEVYLVGTMTSILVAMLSGTLLRLVL